MAGIYGADIVQLRTLAKDFQPDEEIVALDGINQVSAVVSGTGA